MLIKALKYSIPILPHNLSNNLSTYSVKLIINNYIGYALSGLYTLASQFSTIVNMVQNSVNLAFRPWFVEQMQNGEDGRVQIKHTSCMIMSVLSFCCVGVSVLSKEVIILLADKDYVDAWMFVPVFVLGQLISFVYYCHVQTLMYNIKMSKYVAVCSFSSLLTNIALSLALVGYFGIYAMLIALIVSKIVLCTITVLMSNRAENVDFGLWKMVQQTVIYCILSAIGMWISMRGGPSLDWGAVGLKLILLVAAVFIYLAPYREDYLKLLSGFLKKNRT
jgi:O-antigen/teichoic acid export membrane protein